MSKKPSKYKNKKTIADGITFDSIKEAKRYQELKLLERAGEIRQLELQPAFKIEHNGVKICTYKGDFAYFTDKCRVVEDCKGFLTPAYRLKKKLMKAFFNIDIFET